MVKQHLFSVALSALFVVSGCVPADGCEGGRCGSPGPSDSLWIEDEGAFVETPTPVAGLPSYIRPLIRVEESGNRVICSAVVISRNTALVSQQCEIGIFYTGGNNQDREGPFFQGEYFLGSANDADGTIRPAARLIEVRGRDYATSSLPVQFLIFDRTIARTSSERAALSALNLRGPEQMLLSGYEVGTSVSSFSFEQSVSPATTQGFFATAIPQVVGFDKTVTVFYRGALVAIANGLGASQNGDLLYLSPLAAHRDQIDSEIESAGARVDNANPLPDEINLYTGRG